MARTILPDAHPREVAPATPPGVPEQPVIVGGTTRGGAGKRMAGLITAAGGLALAGGSIYFALRARSAADELNHREPGEWTLDDKELEDAHYRRRGWAIGLGIASGVAIATGATLYVLGLRDRANAREHTVSLSVGDRGGAVVWQGSF